MKKPSYNVGDVVVLTLQATSIIDPNFGLGCMTAEIIEIEQDPHFGPCYRFKNTEGSWPESSIAYRKGE